ncbi:MAG: hypothetical protein JWM10_5280 [Myxococcaceae bacterium]|nr:hypothetical protein [Myxococcaceae bacterium]
MAGGLMVTLAPAAEGGSAGVRRIPGIHPWPMLICAVGDAHGEFDAMYAAVEALESEVGRRVACVLHVGDFGVWPDPEHLDEATERHGDRGGFRKLLRAGSVPRRTVFIAGNHEDFDYLVDRRSNELIENLEFLPWGEVVTLRHEGETVRVGGIGGCYGTKDYPRERVQGWNRRHYIVSDLRRLVRNAGDGVDILLVHEPPAGEVTECHAPPGMGRRTWRLQGEGQAELVAQVRPRICFSGHIHARTERRIAGVRVVGLHKVPVRGSCLLFEIPPVGEVTDLAEWGGAPSADATPVPEVLSESEMLGEEAFAELSTRLTAWSDAVLAGRALDREGRKRAHSLLREDPMRAVLMGALTGADLRGLVFKGDDARARDQQLREWLAQPLPDPSRFQ